VQVPVRVVAATNRDLRAEVAAGAFREDVYFRLAAYEIVLPPLRARRADIPALVEHFRRRHAERLGLDPQSAVSKEVLEMLAAHPWPGNVRELEHVVQRALVDSGSLTDGRRLQELLGSRTAGAAAAEAVPAIGDDLSLRELETLHIEAVLKRCGGNRTRAAAILGIERKSLYRKAERLGIPLDHEEDSS
jgi:DNA-binding NtrC family response regulator